MTLRTKMLLRHVRYLPPHLCPPANARFSVISPHGQRLPRDRGRPPLLNLRADTNNAATLEVVSLWPQ